MLRGNVTTDVPDDWDIDNDGAAVSQLDVNDEATLLPQDSSWIQSRLNLSDNHNDIDWRTMWQFQSYD